ncbi:17-beta-hydroxysteroid dehydrogenase 13 [Monomorium pharaonis]|uniref:17-beta-hydroxysteroid dehydrogenase 13 n=1 Tax=Monomorium pharaonis TaxID=307658 RepID=UPI00063FBA26|nr:17-beta-hydroxysteroid dehydrogenase 13 [Monomorium pharaonis]XP_012524887.1 17-beta-hydroxysteroid dehydrogenase 13 [Monomorium pharaonis]XP_012524888.1 17-beta-hydroxysteroid dehydrogenase 13 [Monomorium pharaonis]XP_012524889.1 17-beta-hydroxysteroid dehydrogenase 13 [Monomorium pharaonis]XP_028047621.1 17-beta-hydroxysteroid dehydrogenase 13 [Monomorium pharaonis]
MDAINIIQIVINVLRLILQILYYICQSVYYNFFGLPEKSVIGEIVLITGTGHGIGKELAIQYACLGATIVCLDINKQANEETVKEIKTINKNAYAYQCDVTRREDVFAVAKKVKEEVGDVTILVNNAGIMPCHVLLDHTINEIVQLFNVNVLAHFWILQAFLPSMIEKNYGHIVALSSITGIVGLPNLVPYSATKHAVQGLMDALENELRVTNNGKSFIKFTTIYPYMVDTGLCKKPKINKMLEAFLLLSSTKDTAGQIIKAQRQNIKTRSVPSFWLPLVSFVRLLPENAQTSIIDFIDSGVEPS